MVVCSSLQVWFGCYGEGSFKIEFHKAVFSALVILLYPDIVVLSVYIVLNFMQINWFHWLLLKMPVKKSI